MLKNNIRVIIIPDGPSFFAQGVEVDCAAQGDTIEEVKNNFEDGLSATVYQHLKVYGHIEKLLVPTPVEAFKEIIPEMSCSFALLGECPIVNSALPFDGIDYFG